MADRLRELQGPRLRAERILVVPRAQGVATQGIPPLLSQAGVLGAARARPRQSRGPASHDSRRRHADASAAHRSRETDGRKLTRGSVCMSKQRDIEAESIASALAPRTGRAPAARYVDPAW